MKEINNNTINWFPGHMAKALREMEEKIKLVDLVIVLLDARIPYSSFNPELKRLLGNKKTLYVYVLAVCVFSDIYRVFLDFLCQYPQLFRLYNCADISCADYLPDFALFFGQKRYYNFKPSYKTRCFYC